MPGSKRRAVRRGTVPHRWRWGTVLFFAVRFELFAEFKAEQLVIAGGVANRPVSHPISTLRESRAVQERRHRVRRIAEGGFQGEKRIGGDTIDTGIFGLRVIDKKAVDALLVDDVSADTIRQRQIVLLPGGLPQIDKRENRIRLMILRLAIQPAVRAAGFANIAQSLAFGDTSRDFPDGTIRFKRPGAGIGEKKFISRRIGFQYRAFFPIIAIAF